MDENRRFINVNHEIWQNGEWWCSAGGEHCADVIATALNMVTDENKQLKQFQNIAEDYNIPFDKLCTAFEDMLNCDCYTDCKNEINRYRKENEQLKQQLKDCKDKYNHLITYGVR